MRDIWKSVASVSGARAYSLVGSAAMIMIVARWLGPAGQGIVGAATAWALLFATMGSLSLGQVAMHRATIRRQEQWLGDTMGTLVLFAGVVTILCWIGAAILYAATGARTFGSIPPGALAVGFLMVPFLVWETYGGQLLTAIDRISVYNRAQMVGRTVGIALMCVCWWAHFGVMAALGIAVVSQMAIAGIGVRELWRAAGGRVRATSGEAYALLRGAAQLHLNTINSYIFTSVGVLIVNHYCSATETGWYQFSMSLVSVMIVVPLSASAVLSARVVRLGPDEAWSVHRNVLLFLPAAMIGAAILAAVCAPVAIPIVVGPKYIPAIPVFQLSVFGVVGLTVAALMTSQWIGRGYFWQMSAISIAVTAIHLAAMWWLVHRNGMYGAVYANLISSGVAVVGNGIFALVCEMKFRHGIRQALIAAV